MSIAKQIREYDTRQLEHSELEHLFLDLVADWKQNNRDGASSTLENRIAPSSTVIPASNYVAGMAGKVVIPSEDDYWRIHE